MTATREQEAEVEVHSQDADGNWFYWGDYEQAIIKNNPNFFKYLIDKTREFKGETHFICGSNRQSHHNNNFIILNKKTPCFFDALRHIAHSVHHQAKREIFLSTLLLADIHQDCPAGTSWQDPTIDLRYNAEKRPLFDVSKVILLFMQMHYYSHMHPNKKIIFNFYDDITDKILYPLQEIFSKFPQLIPSNVELHLYQHTTYKQEPGKSIIPDSQIFKVGVIQGKQKHRLDYRYLVKTLLQILEYNCKEDQHGYYGQHAIDLLAEHNELDKFLMSTHEKPFQSDKIKLQPTAVVAAESKDTPVKLQAKTPAIETKSTPEDAWIPWLFKQLLNQFGVRPEVILYKENFAYSHNDNSPHDEFDLTRRLQAPKKLSPFIDIALHQLKFMQLTEMKVTPRDFCRQIKYMLLVTLWNTNHGGKKYKLNEDEYTTLPRVAHLIVTCIDMTKKHKDWDATLRNIHAAAENAAKNKPKFAMFKGGERDGVTQAFYELLAEALARVLPQQKAKSAMESKDVMKP